MLYVGTWLSHIPFRSRRSSKFTCWRNPVPCSCRSEASVLLLVIIGQGHSQLPQAAHSSFPLGHFHSSPRLPVSPTSVRASSLVRAHLARPHPIESSDFLLHWNLSDLGTQAWGRDILSYSQVLPTLRAGDCWERIQQVAISRAPLSILPATQTITDRETFLKDRKWEKGKGDQKRLPWRLAGQRTTLHGMHFKRVLCCYSNSMLFIITDTVIISNN